MALSLDIKNRRQPLERGVKATLLANPKYVRQTSVAGAPPFASFAPLRLCENRRLNEETYLAQRRKGAKAQRRKGAFANSISSRRS
jgi:hypothetical protein